MLAQLRELMGGREPTLAELRQRLETTESEIVRKR